MILIGFMGCGKTTIAHEIGKKLNKQVIDLDAVIPVIANKTIPEIFAKEGEAAFRKYEFQALSETLSKDVIIATGGGVVTFDKSYELLQAQKEMPVFFLNAPFENLYERIQADDNRPLGNQDIETVRNLYQSRLKKYQALSDKEISTAQPIENTAEAIISFSKQQQ
ncbi:shikimate kinase [Jeotgalicoccus aerolatus]|uniref:Shikimate kinase n=1 Tax=Jeotgalicoccus aerolatus TaxID=709510 RepID=A0A1G8UT82_9STAP|nr:shikimate kinase [Jeotgalicoccus aerolatus]NMA81128.1 shikimate kinase [Jeotgalicoccus aerolatus]SDJ56295.1 shikimate kinase [Jeotgalicoccus aerolatus]HJG32987.1 shikimate kinase [Jeotgalicoccus aerolatus]